MLIRNSLTFVAAKAVPSVLGMATSVILTHVLNPPEYGLYGISLIVMTFGTSVFFDWLTLCLTRFYEARQRDPKVIGTVVHLFLMMVVLIGFVLFLAWLFGLLNRPEGKNYATGAAMLCAYAWFELVASVKIVEIRSLDFFRLNAGRAVCVLVASVGAAWLTRDASWTACGTATGLFAGSYLRRQRLARLGPANFDVGLARDMIVYGFPLALALIMGGLTYSGVRALVEWFDSSAALGYYTAAFLLVQSTLVVVASGIQSVTYQLAVRAFEAGDASAIRRQFLQNGEVLLSMLAPAALGASLTARGMSTTLVAAQYTDAVAQLIPWLAAGAFFGSVRASYFDYAFQLGHRPLRLLRVLTVSAIISVGLGYGLIPILGTEGAAIAFMVATGVSCIHGYIEGRWVMALPLPVRAFTKVSVACIVMAVAVRQVDGHTPIDFILQVVVGMAVYSLAALALNVLNLRESIIKRIFYRSSGSESVGGSVETGYEHSR
jgi:O-antigen/teichoic acid export membrane protein